MRMLDAAFQKLFPGVGFDLLAPWQKARRIIDEFSVPALGEELALWVLCEIVCYVDFPDQRIQQNYILRAENKMPELLDIFCDHEIHMDEAALMLRYLEEGKTLGEIRATWCSAKV